MSKQRWFLSVSLCVKDKFQMGYKDINDNKFDEVVKYIEFLKKNPS
jgi:hypothetical protein